MGSQSKMMASVTKCGCARHMEPPEEEFMMIVVAIVIALMRQNLKKGVYLINRWSRWQTDACVQNSLIVMKMLVEMRVVAVIGDGDQNQDKPGKLLGKGWGGEGAPAPAILILSALISNRFLCLLLCIS